MDTIAREALIKAAKGQENYCRRLVDRAVSVAPYLNSERNSFWDALFLAKFYEESLHTLLPIIETAGASLPWTARLCSSVIDDAVPGRGLLAQTLFFAIEAGLVANSSDALRFHQRLYRALKRPKKCLVAYLDYVGAGKEFDWRKFQAVWHSMHAEAVSLGMVGYYWRSSDSFYFARSVTGMEQADLQATCTAFLDFLLNIQTHHCLNDQRWMWQIGVALEKGALIGDIFLPNKGGPQAAIGMKEGVDKIRGGGVMLVTESFKNALPGKRSTVFCRAPLVGKKEKKKEVKWFYYDQLRGQ